MDMKEFNNIPEIKFMIVLGKMEASIFNKVERHIKKLGINKTEFMIMYAIASHGSLTIQDIGERISMTSGNMTYTIDKLEKKGWIKRVRCPEDRRRIYIDFTEDGKANWSKMMDEHMKHIKDLFSVVDSSILSETISNMKLIGRAFDEE